LRSTSCRNRLHGSWGNGPSLQEELRISGNCLEWSKHLERRVQIRFFVHALEDIMWMGKGILHRGQGFTRDINSNGMFIYSDSEPRAQGDIEVEASFPSLGEAHANLRIRTQSLIIRREPPPSPEEQRGFAILNRSYKLHERTIPLKRET
jgi:hypothetical protein